MTIDSGEVYSAAPGALSAFRAMADGLDEMRDSAVELLESAQLGRAQARASAVAQLQELLLHRAEALLPEFASDVVALQVRRAQRGRAIAGRWDH